MSTTFDDLKDSTILIVDDSESSSRMLHRILVAEGYHVTMVADGYAALDSIDVSPPDLVLLDVMMPMIDGFKVLQKIRANPETAELPIIMTTALDQPDDIIYGLEHGANDYVTKPALPEIIVARVKNQLRTKHVRDQQKLVDAVKDKFLQIAAHDLQNPVANISLGVDLLAEKITLLAKVYPESEALIKTLRDAAKMMQSMINDFLDHDALRSGRVQLNICDVMINQELAAAMRQFEFYAAKKGVTVESCLDPAVPSLQADPDRLNQIASNLIGNAIKFSKPGGKIEVRTRLEGCGVRVEVEDNGPGISADEIPLLFQEFMRLRNRPTGGERSSGLGLAISRKLVELHGGKIGALSQLGEGSTFWFEIPLNPQENSLVHVLNV